MGLNKSTTANIWTRWPQGMRIPLTLYQKGFTGISDTSDPYGPPISCGACRRRNADFKMVTAMGPGIVNSKTRIFEIFDSLKTVQSGNGITVIQGSGAPSDSTGSNTDYYWDTLNNVTYGPKASGAWPTTAFNLLAREGDRLQEADGTNWEIQPSNNLSLFDNLQILICTKDITSGE